MTTVSTTIHDIYKARPHVYAHLRPTPLYQYQGLSELVGARVFLKHENHQPVGAFKVRGGLNLVANLSTQQKQGGLFTASTGNHGQSIAFAARAHGVKATIAVPEGANPGKVAAMEGLGAEVVFHGPDFDSARLWIEQVAGDREGTFVGPTDELLIHGVGTYGLEILEELPDVDVIIVPVGAGSGVCGTAVVAKSLNPKIKVIGVQSAQAPTQQQSWLQGKPVEAGMKTIAEGLATRISFANTQAIMAKYLDDFVLVEDTALEEAVRLLLRHSHNLVEEAGAASMAAALSLSQSLQGKKIALVVSGGNISPERLTSILGSQAAG